MADAPYTDVYSAPHPQPPCKDKPGEISEAVCIDANRVYDSCGDKDCLADMTVYFTAKNQDIICDACNVRIREANVITTTVNLEPVAFHKGFYAVDMTFYFEIILDVYMSSGCLPTTVNGLSVFSKRVILYGSEGNVKVFSSDSTCEEQCSKAGNTPNLPKATVQVAKPMALSAYLRDCGTRSIPCRIPCCIADYMCGDIVAPTTRTVTATIGIFTIVQIERNVQMLIPAYDFCVPRKECVTTSGNPCEVFNNIDFPTNEFFPPKVTDVKHDECAAGHFTESCCEG